MKPATIRYTIFLGVLLLGTAVAWNGLLEAGGTIVPVSKLMQAAHLFEQQGRPGKAAGLYRRVLTENPGHVQAKLRLIRLKKKAESVLGVASLPTQQPVSTVRLAQAEKPVSQPVEPVAQAVGPVAKADSLPKEVTSVSVDPMLSQKRSARPKNALPKTRSALSKVGDRFRGLIPGEFKGLIPGFAVSQRSDDTVPDKGVVAPRARNVSDSGVKIAREEKARLAAKSSQEERARLAARAAEAEKARLAAKAAVAEKARLAAKAAEAEKARLAAKAALENEARLVEREVNVVKPNEAGPAAEQAEPAEATDFKSSKAKGILGQVGKKIQGIVPKPSPGRPDFEEIGVIPPKPQIPMHLKRNGLAETSPSLRRPVQELDENGQPVRAADVVAPAEKPEDVAPVADGTVLPKTQRVLGRVKARVGGLLPRVPGELETSGALENARQVVDGLLPRRTTPLKNVASEGLVPESKDVETVDAGPGFISRSRAAWAKIRKGVTSSDRAKPKVERSPKVAADGLVPESKDVETVDAGPGFISRSRAAWEKIRKGVTSSDRAKPKVERSPLWNRLTSALAGRKSEVIDLEEPAVANGDAVVTSRRATPGVRDGKNAPLTLEEQVAGAGMKLAVDADDSSARAKLVQMVASAPDFEAALAAYTLGTRAKGHADIMDALGRQLLLRGEVAKVHMAEAMLRFDGNHATATESLVNLTASEDKRVRMLAAFSMQAATKVQRERCITILIKVLKDEDSDVRASAALALGAFGPSAKRAIPAIVTVIHDVDPGTARAAGVALQCVASKRQDAKVIRPVAAESLDSK